MSDSNHIRIESPIPALRVVTLDRPERRNAMSTAMTKTLLAFFEGLAADAGEVRCVVLTGAGDRAFSAGGDLKERRTLDEAGWHAQHRLVERLVRAVLDCPVPVIAAVNGAAFAGGLELALACDILYAVEGCRFALPEVRLGIMPGAGGTQTLPRRVGAARAKELIFTGSEFDAAQALQWGVVNAVVPPEALTETVLSAAERIAANAPLAVRQAKLAISRGMAMDLPAGLAFEAEAYARLVASDDRVEGLAAYKEKRKPNFAGR